MRFREYIEYVKDNPEGYWFKRKLYGWGWVPATREGFAVTLLVLGAIILLSLRAERPGLSDAEALREIILPAIALVLLLIIVCYKTGEPPRWTWGKREKDKSKHNG